ncbi:MAG TPA: permease [Candidatus Hydrogenedens sp.]|nr:permease [Candidatus Hydrogenedens sp.]HOL19311.1 permease [Candidatus Hydrogenedens sp.]HPP59264.1 permease [Candidatus Hydrogenedens sp.]
MNFKQEWKILFLIVLIFFVCYFLPVGTPRFDNAVMEALYLIKWYAREHVLLCLVPAFFIAGAIGVFISQNSVMKYLGADANKFIAYGVASVSGTILAVCSCTVLPLFSGIYKMGAGLGPATAFLYSGPAINVLAIILTARILGLELGLARAIGAVLFSIIIGLLMFLIFRKEEIQRTQRHANMPVSEPTRPLWKTAVFFASMIAILVFANWGKPESNTGFWYFMFQYKWIFTSLSGVILGIILGLWFEIQWWKIIVTAMACIIVAILFPHEPVVAFSVGFIGLSIITLTGTDETKEWFSSTWNFAKQILPLLLAGVFIAGFLLGRPGNEGVIPNAWVYTAVGGNSIRANFLASIVGAFMYFATLTEVPILQGLIGSGMGKGPALALLLAGPALSLPSMIVIYNILGLKKTVTYISLVVIMATITGILFGVIV